MVSARGRSEPVLVFLLEVVATVIDSSIERDTGEESCQFALQKRLAVVTVGIVRVAAIGPMNRVNLTRRGFHEVVFYTIPFDRVF